MLSNHVTMEEDVLPPLMGLHQHNLSHMFLHYDRFLFYEINMYEISNCLTRVPFHVFRLFLDLLLFTMLKMTFSEQKACFHID